MIRSRLALTVLATMVLAATTARAEETSPFNGSEAVYRHALGLRGLDQDADPTWNPTYLHALSLAPQYTLNKHLTLAGEMEVAGDFTRTDWTTDPVYWSDLTLSLKAPSLMKLHDDATTLGASIGLRLPTSLVSQTHTLVMAPSLTGHGSHRVTAVPGLELSVEIGAFRPIHQTTTGQLQGTTIRNCRTTSCQTLNQIPTLNIQWGARQMLNAQWQIKPWVIATLFAGGTQSKLHRAETSTEVTFQVTEPRQWRYEFSSGALLSHPIFKGGIFSYGIASTHPLFKANGHERYAPLVNRHTVAFLELRLSLAEFIN